MEKIIVNNKWRTVIYDIDKKIYKKYIRPKFREKVEIFFGMKKAHGKNAYELSRLLKNNGIKTYEVISYTKYSYVTKEIKGKTLYEKIIEVKDDQLLLEEYIDKYMIFVNKIINLGLYYSDFYFNNLMVDENNEICMIDIDEMQKTWYSKLFKNKKVVPRLKKTLRISFDRFKGLGINLDAEKFIKKYYQEG